MKRLALFLSVFLYGSYAHGAGDNQQCMDAQMRVNKYCDASQTETVGAGDNAMLIENTANCQQAQNDVNTYCAGSPDSPPVSPPTNTTTTTDTAVSITPRIDSWVATKFNDDLLIENPDLKKKDVDATQADSFVLQSNVLYGCVETSLDGRKDDTCQNDPDNPECVGLSGALSSATTCKEYFDPPSLGCKVYGKGDYSMEEWVAVGEQYHSSMTNCADVKSAADAKTDVLQSLTEMLIFDPNLHAPDAPSLGSVKLRGSSVSGDLEDPLKVNASGWEDLAEKFTDGASYLGYENGDILRATAKGESYASILSSSPFAEKLNAVNRQKFDEALEDSKMIATRVAQTSRERRGDASEESMPRINQSPDSVISSSHDGVVGEEADGIGVIKTGIPAAAAVDSTAEIQKPGRSLASLSQPTSSPAIKPKKPAHRLTEAERIEAIQRAAALSRLTHEPYRAPASGAENTALAAPAEALTDLSLFQRVSRTYRKHSLWMNPLSEHSGDKLRSMAKPEIFREL